MHRETGRLVDDQKMLVFIGDVKVALHGLQFALRFQRFEKGDRLAARDLESRTDFLAVHRQTAVLYESCYAGARNGLQSLGKENVDSDASLFAVVGELVLSSLHHWSLKITSWILSTTSSMPMPSLAEMGMTSKPLYLRLNFARLALASGRSILFATTIFSRAASSSS